MQLYKGRFCSVPLWKKKYIGAKMLLVCILPQTDDEEIALPDEVPACAPSARRRWAGCFSLVEVYKLRVCDVMQTVDASFSNSLLLIVKGRIPASYRVHDINFQSFAVYEKAHQKGSVGRSIICEYLNTNWTGEGFFCDGDCVVDEQKGYFTAVFKGKKHTVTIKAFVEIEQGGRTGNIVKVSCVDTNPSDTCNCCCSWFHQPAINLSLMLRNQRMNTSVGVGMWGASVVSAMLSHAARKIRQIIAWSIFFLVSQYNIFKVLFFQTPKKMSNAAIAALIASLRCPIRGRVMLDPVILAGTGLSYERSSIEEHLRATETDPESGIVLDASQQRLLPNLALKGLILAIVDVVREWGFREH
jgi:hypothetical protein